MPDFRWWRRPGRCRRGWRSCWSDRYHRSRSSCRTDLHTNSQRYGSSWWCSKLRWDEAASSPFFNYFFLLLLHVFGKPVNFYKHLTCSCAYISCLIEISTRVQCFNIFLASILCIPGHIVHCVFLFVSSVSKCFPCLFVQEQVMDFTGLFGFFMHSHHTAGFHKEYDWLHAIDFTKVVLTYFTSRVT